MESKWCSIIIDKICVFMGQFLTLHWPNCYLGLGFTSCCNNVGLIIWNFHKCRIRLENVSREFRDFSEIDTVFSHKLEDNNSFVECQCCIIILLSDGNSTGSIVIETDEKFLRWSRMIIFLPIFKIEHNKLIFSIGEQNFWTFEINRCDNLYISFQFERSKI